MLNETPVVLGKYQLIRKLASGGMAEVYLARAAGPMGFEKQVVVKRILPHLAEEENFISMFQSEARLAAQLNHPNVVQVFDFGVADNSYFLVMEFIDGVNLRVLFRKAAEQKVPLSFPLMARVVSLACEGLAYAHDFVDPATGQPMGLVHRDVSPDNILIARNGSVRVVDFGIAKAANQTNLTKTGTVKGKFAYMPPEQLTGQPLDRRADVFALGIVLFELLTGRKPFDTSNEAFIVRAIMYEDMAPARQFRPDVPEALQNILDRALAKHVEDRYPDCRAMQADLERFILQLGEPVTQFQLAQLVQGLNPAVSNPIAQVPTSPLPPIGPKPVAATVEEVDLSTALMATPPPQPSVVAPAVKREPPPPPVPTQSNPMLAAPTGLDLNVPMLPAAPRQQRPPPPPPVDPGGGQTVPDLSAISMRDELSQERLIPLQPPKRSTAPMLVVALLGAVALGVGITWWWRSTHATTEPVPQPVAVKPAPAVAPAPTTPKPTDVVDPPIPTTQLTVVTPPTDTTEIDPGPKKPETVPEAPPIAAQDKPKPPDKVRGKPTAVKPTVTKPTAAVSKAQVEFRVRPFGAVWVDGSFVGDTPFAPASLSLGAHTIKVVNRELGKEVVRQLEVKEGTNVFRHSFEE